jgi:hypothetical protein
MTGLERRLAKLEAASVLTVRMPVIFVSFRPGPDLPATATVDGRVWHREPGPRTPSKAAWPISLGRRGRVAGRWWCSWNNGRAVEGCHAKAEGGPPCLEPPGP